MKILDSKKDYYDFLQGIYGVDEKLILDRTKSFKNKSTHKDYDLIRFYICGYIVEGMYMNNDWRYGIELEKYHTDKTYNADKNKYHIIPNNHYRSINILKTPFKITDDSKNHNLKFDCPILNVLTSNGWHHDDTGYLNEYPILKDYNVNKVFTAEQIWLMLSEFLGREKNNINFNNQSDKEKIIGFGFDIKTSFRKM